MKTKLFGRYIVTDPAICHGKPAFRGTRILVADVLEQVDDGLTWAGIIEEGRGSISHAAIEEVAAIVRRLLRQRSFRTKAHRKGAVVRVSRVGLAVWQLHAENEAVLAWD